MKNLKNARACWGAQKESISGTLEVHKRVLMNQHFPPFREVCFVVLRVGVCFSDTLPEWPRGSNLRPDSPPSGGVKSQTYTSGTLEVHKHVLMNPTCLFYCAQSIHAYNCQTACPFFLTLQVAAICNASVTPRLWLLRSAQRLSQRWRPQHPRRLFSHPLQRQHLRS